MGKEAHHTIIFSDECKFNLDWSDGKLKIWRTSGTGLDEQHIIFKNGKNSPSVMYWGCMSGNGVGRLVKCNGNMKRWDYIDIIASNLDKSSEKMNLFPYIFQQDNASIHKAKDTMDFFKEKNIRLLHWPAKSPDLNPIENIWCILKSRVAERCPKNKIEFEHFIEEEWNKIDKKLCEKLIESFGKRCKLIINAKGGYIDY